jgi:hypothetical protein
VHARVVKALRIAKASVAVAKMEPYVGRFVFTFTAVVFCAWLCGWVVAVVVVATSNNG